MRIDAGKINSALACWRRVWEHIRDDKYTDEVRDWKGVTASVVAIPLACATDPDHQTVG